MNITADETTIWYDGARVFQGLAKSGYEQAAVGLLRDLFAKLARRDDELIPGSPRMPTIGGRQNPTAQVRDQVMAILDDHDGTKLRHWLDGYESGQPAFDEAAKAWVKEVRSKKP